MIILIFAGSYVAYYGPFISQHETDVQKIASYLQSNNLTKEKLYVNDQYPVFAYYADMNVTILPQSDGWFYQAYYETNPQKGLIAIENKTGIEPGIGWALNNSNLSLIDSEGSYFFFNITPKNNSDG